MTRRRIVLGGGWCAAVVGVLTLTTPAMGVPGDLDCSGEVTMADLDAFALALVDPDGYAAAYSGCEIMQADMNEDWVLDGLDIPEFMAVLLEITPVEPPIATQLAGNSLSGYPYFEYVKAFNEDATVEVAIDPTLFPEIVGETGDVYIVEAKSPIGWSLDASLTDVSMSGPQTVTFGGSTIEENTFVVTGAYELDSAVFVEATGDYTGLGHGYDIVLDMNQNGMLDGDDYIDGFGKEAGLYVVHDTTQRGPLAVTSVPSYSVGAIFGIPSTSTNAVMFYPTDIATMDPLPLIVVGHGGGHQYTWYSHIGEHMASYGYIVVSHENCYGSPDCTLGHTDAILDMQGTIAGGAIDGKVDPNRIIWIGHSLGGMGVVNAFDTLMDGEYTPTYYTADSIVLISSMLPNSSGGPDEANPHHVNFHLWTAAGDTDISGSPGSEQTQTFLHHDRATNYRMSTVVQGVGHAWFHNGPPDPSYFSGPCALDQETTHKIELGLFLPLIKYYAEGNIPASDFFWRQYERFHPIGVDTTDPCVVVSNEYRNGNDEGNYFIDDYQTATSLNASSSGGAVSYTVSNVLEGNLDDLNGDFSWTVSDPFNGATHASEGDTSRGVVFDWNGPAYYEWSIVPALRDFSDDLYLSFRAAQGTQHPYTLDVLDDLTFTVMLRDSGGTTSSINIGAYGGGLEQPYQRSGGWHDDFEVIRIRPTDFLANGSGIDLRDIAAVRFNFGPFQGSIRGRIVVDELMLTNDFPPYFIPMTLGGLVDPPEFIPPHVATPIQVMVLPGDDSVVEGQAFLHYTYDGFWLQTPLVQISDTVWEGQLPPPECADMPEYYVSVEGAGSGTLFAPAGGATAPAIAVVGSRVDVLVDDFNADLGWTVENIALTGGAWERVIPSTDGSYGEPTEDYDGSGYCYVTGNDHHADVDGGPTRLISPLLDMSTLDNPVLRYARWWANDDQDYDPFIVQISNDDGATWYNAETVMNVEPDWTYRTIYVLSVVPSLSDQMRVRVSVMDNPNNSKDEAAFDAFEIFDVSCE